MTPSRTASTFVLIVAFFLASSESFSVGGGSLAFKTMSTPATTAVFAQRSPVSSTVAFFRRGRTGNTDDASSSSSVSRSPMGGQSDADQHGEPTPTNEQKPKRTGYQRVEEWDEEQKSGAMSWEQKVQFDGLRMGNGVRQNDILMKHLSAF